MECGQVLSGEAACPLPSPRISSGKKPGCKGEGDREGATFFSCSSQKVSIPLTPYVCIRCIIYSVYSVYSVYIDIFIELQSE